MPSQPQALRRLQQGVVVMTLAAALAAAPSAQDPQPLPSDALFDSSVVQRIDLRMNSTDWEKLKQNFQENTYYPTDFVFNGQTVHNTGIRSRGSGSRSGTKPGLRVDFDRYATGQTFLGLTALVLDNLTQDPSAVHETVTMKLFTRLGIPAPREAHVRLYVNEAYSGLYASIEEINSEFLARAFGSIGDDVQNDGYLYEYDYVDAWMFSYLGADLAPYEARFSPETHGNQSDAELFGPIEQLVSLANSLTPEQYPAVLGEKLDLNAFVRFVAAQNFMGENDGFLGYAGMNNFYLYRLEDSPTHVLIAWDDDNSFWGPEFPIHHRDDENVLMRKSMQVPALKEQYDRVMGEAMRVADGPAGTDGVTWLEYETRRQLDLIYDALAADPVKPYTLDEHVNARNAAIGFARNRSSNIRGQLAAGAGRN